jgi:hypothetical protein
MSHHDTGIDPPPEAPWPRKSQQVAAAATRAASSMTAFQVPEQNPVAWARKTCGPFPVKR